MIKYQVVAINENGEIIDAITYDHTNDSGRVDRVQAAMQEICNRHGLSPVEIGSGRSVVGEDGTEWGKMSGEDIQPGMVEIGFGKWGFEKKRR